MALLKRVSLKGVVVSRDNNNNNIRRAVVDIIVRAIVRPILEEGDDIFATSAIFFLYFKTLNIHKTLNIQHTKKTLERSPVHLSFLIPLSMPLDSRLRAVSTRTRTIDPTHIKKLKGLRNVLFQARNSIALHIAQTQAVQSRRVQEC